MKRDKNKFKYFLITLLFVTSLFLIIPSKVYALNTNQLWNKILDFNHGGSGTLNASYLNNTLTVTGTVTGASNPLELNIDSDVTIIWKANYSGTFDLGGSEMIYLSGKGTFEVASGGSIKNIDGLSYTINSLGPKIIINGGTVTSSKIIAIYSRGNVDIKSGTVEGPRAVQLGYGYSQVLNVSGGTLRSNGTTTSDAAIFTYNVSSNNPVINITGGIIDNKGVGSAIYAKDPSTKINISGGFIFSHSNTISGNASGSVIRMESGTPKISGTPTICGWNKPSGTPTYYIGSQTDLVANSGAKVKWGQTGKGTLLRNGIIYGNSSFYTILGVVLNPSPTFSITVQNDGNGTASASKTGATIGTEISLSTTPSSGFIFKEWQVVSGGITINNNKFTIGNANVIVKAIFTIAPAYNVTVENGKVDNNKQQGGALVTISADIAPEGKVFDKWTTSDGITFADEFNQITNFLMPNKNVTVTATYKDLPIGTYTINIMTNGNGVADANVTSAKQGEEITLSYEANEGYHFTKWIVSGDGNVVIINNKFIMPSNNLTIEAVFESDINEKSVNFNWLWIIFSILVLITVGGLITFIILKKKEKLTQKREK